MWTYRVAISVYRSGQVLNAFWRRGDVDLYARTAVAAPGAVLNAFWRRGDVDAQLRFDRAGPPAGVLNAFWRRGDVDYLTVQRATYGSLGAQRLLATGRCGRGYNGNGICCNWCSTPFGDGAMWTWPKAIRFGNTYCAQRLLATGRCGRALVREFVAGDGVLNAFWRRGDVDPRSRVAPARSAASAQRLLATGRCGPLSIDMWTGNMSSAQRLLATGRCGRIHVCIQ